MRERLTVAFGVALVPVLPGIVISMFAPEPGCPLRPDLDEESQDEEPAPPAAWQED